MIGIVILNFENWHDTKSCVESIFENPPEDDFTIILVDNASHNVPNFDLNDFIEKYRIVFIRNKKNLGYNAGNNTGIAEAQKRNCESILISNNDVKFFNGSIQAMQDFLSRHPKVGIVGPKILDYRGHLQKSNLYIKTGMKEKYILRTKARILFKRHYQRYFGLNKDYAHIDRVHAVLGCCFMISKQCAAAVTPLDEHPFLYEEEFMLGIRMEEKGFLTVYIPNAVIQHRHGGSTHTRKAFSFAHNVRSEIYYCRKYLRAVKWQVYLLYCYRVLLYLTRCAVSRDFRKNWKWFMKITKEEFQLEWENND